ncbi:MAG: endonuclease/exonuclease/phosphatase [Acidobacteria bacterium]|nr:endonuclease/exonuclease/phosphatase [Acidobacteriota bacterium]
MRHSRIWLVIGLLGLPGSGGTADAPARHPPHALTVVSLNLAMREDVDRIVSELTAVGTTDVADLILLQEVVQRERSPSVARQLGERLGLDSMYREAFLLDNRRSVGLAILSRYRWHDVRVLGLRRFDLVFRNRDRIALVATVDTPGGRVQVYNVHLDSRINLDQRIEQVTGVAGDVGSFDGPAIIGGDFNTNDNHWLFHTIPLPFIERQASGLQQFMEGRGFRSAFSGSRPTHDALGMQLDWVFTRGFDTLAASIHPVDVSDHHALMVSLVPTTTRREELHGIIGMP